ncbi:hypothetical protein HBI16_015110 [Parastagonospora nodorum]|nr:hypothetical protein HBI16_015110 [Parastagonospora nodorum]
MGSTLHIKFMNMHMTTLHWCSAYRGASSSPVHAYRHGTVGAKTTQIFIHTRKYTFSPRHNSTHDLPPVPRVQATTPHARTRYLA